MFSYAGSSATPETKFYVHGKHVLYKISQFAVATNVE